jgi:hypothetical protein
MNDPRPQGIPRNDVWLSLEDDAWPTREMLVKHLSDVYRIALMAAHAPAGKNYFDRMNSPQSGDLVFEYMMRDPNHGIGYLVEKRRELVWPDAEDERDREITEEVWYVQYGQNPEDVCRWENCGFVAWGFDWDMGF